MEHQSQDKQKRLIPASPHSGQALIELYLSLGTEERVQSFPDTARSAEIVGVSRRTIQFWIEVGQLTAIRVGKKYRIHIAALKKLLRSDETI